MKKGKGLPKLTNPGIINGSKAKTKGRPMMAGTNMASGRPATKVSKVK